jgi:hypothetical protein
MLVTKCFDELWENLHHQGDVDLTSYYAVPELVDLIIAKNSFDWNYLGLCFIIENYRTQNNNPSLPVELEQKYFDALSKLERHILNNLNEIDDEDSIRLVLALLATLKGHRKLGSVIGLLDSELIGELLNNYGMGD